MIKVDIINEVAKAADITKVRAEVAVEAVLDAMKALADPNRLRVAGACGREPRTVAELADELRLPEPRDEGKVVRGAEEQRVQGDLVGPMARRNL